MTSAKKRISLVLMVVFLCTCFSFAVAPRKVEAATNGVEQRIAQLQQLFPTGSYFSRNRAACSHTSGGTCGNCQLSNVLPTISGYQNTSLNDAWTCCAFARFAFFYIYGLNTFNYKSVTTNININNAAIGDYVIVNGGTHYGIFLRQDASYVYLYDSNIQGTNRVSYGTRWSKSNYSFQIYRANNYSQIVNSGDNIPPQVSNLWVTDLTNDGYTVYVTVTDNVGVDRVMFPTWTNANGQDDIAWLAGSKQNATTWACRIFSNRDYRGQQDIYHTHVYAYDAAGNQSNMMGTAQYVDKTPPTIADVKVTDISSKGYTVICTANDNNKVDRVMFPTWTLNNDQDDLFENWQTNPKAKGTQNGFTWTYRVNITDHNNEKGLYRTHIYVFDNNGNSTYYRVPDVTVPEKDPVSVTAKPAATSAPTTSAKPTASASSSQASSTIIKGDLMRKGKPTLGSFSLLGQYLLKTKTLDDYQMKAADMNGDGKVSMGDFALLGKKLLGN